MVCGASAIVFAVPAKRRLGQQKGGCSSTGGTASVLLEQLRRFAGTAVPPGGRFSVSALSHGTAEADFDLRSKQY